MIEFCCGAIGALAVLAAFLLGIAAGRKMGGRGVPHHESEEERLLLHEEQRAFENMLHYNMDTAYGLAAMAAAEMGGDRR